VNIALYWIAAMMTINVLANIALVGKERKPGTPGQAAWLTLFNSAYITIIILAALRLG
jgi:hypothetical protein